MGCQAEMVVGILASQCVKSDLMLREIDVRADQAAGPQRADVEGVAQDGGLAGRVGDSHEDHRAAQGMLQVQSPPRRERTPEGGIFDAHGMTRPVRLHKPLRLGLDRCAVSPLKGAQEANTRAGLAHPPFTAG